MPLEIVDNIINELAYTDVFIQNQIISNDKDFLGKNIVAGKNVNNYIPPGEVIISNNAHVNFNATNEVNLKDGFHAEVGTTVNVIIDENLIINCNGSKGTYNKYNKLEKINCKNATEDKRTKGFLEDEDDKFGNNHYYRQVIEKGKIELDPKISPNPNKGRFIVFLDIKDFSEYALDIVNMFGKTVYNTQHIVPGINHIDITNQPKGIYFVKLQLANKVFIEKVIFQ